MRPLSNFFLVFVIALIWLTGCLATCADAAPPVLGSENNGLLTECFKQERAHDDSLQWTLICPFDHLLVQAKKENFENPGLRLVIAREIHRKILELKGSILTASSGGSTEDLTNDSVGNAATGEDGTHLANPVNGVPKGLSSGLANGLANNETKATFFTLFTPLVPANPEKLPRKPVPFESTEGKMISESADLVGEAQFWLKPLFERPDAVLSQESALLYIAILGDSMRFNAAAAFLQDNLKLTSGRSAQNELIRMFGIWIDEFGAPPLRAWLLKKMNELRGDEIKGGRDMELTAWLKSFELEGAPDTSEKRLEVLKKLRELSIVYPDAKSMARIHQSAERLRVASEFKVPSEKDLDLKEMTLRAQALVKNIQSDQALKLMARILEMPRKNLDQEALWDAFMFHVRILRILDLRHTIPETIDKYLEVGRFMEISPKSEDLDKLLGRGVAIARMFWSYDRADRSLEILDKVSTLAKTYKVEGQLAQALYLKARILEQRPDKEGSIKALDEALTTRLPPDLIVDLQWRKFYVELDLSTRNENYRKLIPIIESLKKYSKDTLDRAQWNYWHALVLQLNGKKNLAKQSLREAYKLEPFSFYGNMAGLDLIDTGETPPNWDLPRPELWEANVTWKAPDWDDYFSESGKLKDPAYRELARVYFLGRIGDKVSLRPALGDLERVSNEYILSKKHPEKRRRRFAKAVAWLRLSLKDYIGALHVGENVRLVFGLDMDGEELASLYPLPFWDTIFDKSKMVDLNPWMAASLIRQESAFNPRAQSSANAIGLMQMIPPVAEAEAKMMGIKGFRVDDLFSPDQAVKLGTNHLSRMLKNYQGSMICATASYNAGSPPVERWLDYYQGSHFAMSFIERISYQETRNYVKSIIRNFVNYQRIYGEGKVMKPDLLIMPRVIPGKMVVLQEGEAVPVAPAPSLTPPSPLPTATAR